MTNKEAIRIIQNEHECVKRTAMFDVNCLHCNFANPDREIFAAYDLAIEALKTKIPAKVKIEDWAPAYCPNCGEKLSESLGDGYYDYWTNLEVCPNPDCCQRLDWSEVE